MKMPDFTALAQPKLLSPNCFHEDAKMIQWERFFPPASELQIRTFENDTGIVLPVQYAQYLLSANGGQPRNEICFTIPENSEEVMLGALFGISDDEDDTLGLKAVYADAKDDIPRGFIPIGEDPGGNRLLLATIGSDAEAIVFWDRVGSLAKRTGKQMYRVAANIDDFVQSLRVVRA
jgi:hypothetical protein